MDKPDSLSSHQYIRTVSIDDDVNDKSYPFNIPAIKDLANLSFDQPITFLVGENGTGKSTIIEAIAIVAGFNAEGGTKNNNFSTRDTTSSLAGSIRLSKGIKKPATGYFLRAESFYNVASEIERLDADPEGGALVGTNYGDIPLHHQSHGESFLALVNNRFGKNGLYILDEPEAALSPARQLSLLMRVKQLVASNSQFIIATHSPILLAYPGAIIYELTEQGIEVTKYEETKHYKFTSDFLNNHEAYTRRLGA